MGKHQPALLGGLFIGVLSSLPFLNLANCCCLWVIVGGVLVVYLQQQAKPTPVETGDAVIGGLIAGLVGAIIFSLFLILVSGIGGEMMQENVRKALEQNNELPPEVRENVLRWVGGANFGLLVMALTLPVWAVFGMLGSLLGLAFFRKKLPPQVAPPVPPPTLG